MMKYSVLIVEDEFPAQNLLKKFVSSRKELEFKDIVETEKQLLDALRNNEYDLMLLDIHLHDKVSLNTIKEIENLPYIIFISADAKTAIKAFDLGAIDYLLKPFDKERFDEAINKFISIRTNYTPYEMTRAIKEVGDDSKYKKSNLSEKKVDEIARKLIKYMETKKAFIDPKISLQSISKALNISTNHVSQVINQKFGRNFYEFIYGYRIELVKKLLENPQNDKDSILDICYAAGFNSKSVFNTVFKEFENMTPLQYRKKMRSK